MVYCLHTILLQCKGLPHYVNVLQGSEDTTQVAHLSSSDLWELLFKLFQISYKSRVILPK